MPEGDVLHEWAGRLDVALRGQLIVRAYSPRVALAGLVGRGVTGASAHGKHLLIAFDDGRVLRTHLRMHGKLRLRPAPFLEQPERGPHVRWLLATAAQVAFCIDAPTVELIHGRHLPLHPVLSQLGPDVLAPELDEAEIVRRLRDNPELPLGVALMDQNLLSGIGNIYKSETLFLTAVSPFTPMKRLDDARLQQVVQKARELMRRNLGPGRRTTPRGRIAAPYWVYERSGERCFKCGEHVRMQRQGPLDRSTYFCPECQKEA